MPADYAFVIVHYRSPQTIRTTLASLAAQTLPPQRVLVMDNSGDLELSGAERFVAGVPVEVHALPNPGYGAAINRARALIGEQTGLLFVGTHEVVLEPHTCARLAEFLQAHPEIGCAGPQLQRISDRQAFSYGGRFARGGRPDHLTAPGPDSWYPVAWLDGAMLGLRLEALDAIGGVEERYFLYAEDVDLGARLGEAGYGVAVCMDAVAHCEAGSYPPVTYYLIMRNYLLFARSRYPRAVVLQTVIGMFLRNIPGWLVRRQFSGPWWGVRAIADGYRGVDGPPH